MEIIGGQPRQRWPLEQKLAIVEATFQPGASVHGAAHQAGANAGMVFSWPKQFRAQLGFREKPKTTKHTFVSNTYADLRNDLIADGTLVEHSTELYRFASSAVFDSLSAAAAVVLNRNSNGRIEWKLKSTNQTVKDWQEKGLQSV